MWFLAGVVIGAPAVALVGGFYVAELLDAGSEGAVAGAAGMMAAVMAANAVGLRLTARLQLGLAAPLAPLGADLLNLEGLVQACSASFVAVYVTATGAGVRLLGGAVGVGRRVRRGARGARALRSAPARARGIAAAVLLRYARAAMTPARRSTAVSSSCSAR